MKISRSFLASPEEIRSGKVTDVYFERTRQILKAENIHKRVVMECIVKRFPNGYNWGVFAGLEECLGLLENIPVSVWAMNEGSIFRENEPTLVIEGDYLDFGLYETALLGILCQSSGVATKAARCKKAAGERTLFSFGARRMHPAIAPMIERNAYIGGCDGVAAIKSAEMLGLEPVGTIPHALILLLDDTVKAVQAFHKHIDPNVKRVALIDTFADEKFETLRVAEKLGKNLFAVRLDTPNSRRGSLLNIMKEVRWELDLRGYQHVKLFASGGLDEDSITELYEVADAYGVGTAISNAPVLDFSMDIVEIESKPVAKKGKLSGKKQVWRCRKCLNSQVLPWQHQPRELCECEGEFEPELKAMIQDGVLQVELPSPHEIRNHVIEQLGGLSI